jgi:hypothetical protein
MTAVGTQLSTFAAQRFSQLLKVFETPAAGRSLSEGDGPLGPK